MMGCAWTTPLRSGYSKCSVRFCTLIAQLPDTNHEDMPFLTITAGCNSLGCMFTVLRAYLPNERAWVFRWLFQTVMPTLLGKDGGIRRVKVIVTDGDSHERTSQLDIAISLHFGNVYYVRCARHIVDRGWLRVCPGPRSAAKHKKKVSKAVTNQIKAWLYGRMQPSCEMEEDTKFRKHLFWELFCDILLLSTSSTKRMPNGSEPSPVRMLSHLRPSFVFVVGVLFGTISIHAQTLVMREPTTV